MGDRETKESRRGVAGAFAGVLLGLAWGLGGCAFDEHRDALRAMHERGDYDAARASLAGPEREEFYGEKNELLLRLDRGAVALALDRPEEAVAELSRAEGIMEAGLGGQSALDTLGVLLINDRQARYLGEPYEDLYANVLKLAAQLEAGNVQGGATVEARRMAIKANALRDRYLAAAPRAREEAAAQVGGGSAAPISGIAKVNEEGRFIESPLGLFLTAVAFMQAGDFENQRVAARRLQEAIELQGLLIGDVDAAPFADLGELRPEDANVAVVAFSGRGPYKVPLRLPPLVIDSVPIYVELQILRWEPSGVAAARVIVRGGGEGGGEGAEAARLHLVEDLARVANENHERALPAIYFRTLARTAAKSVGSAIAARSIGSGDSTEFGIALAGLALLIATERADLRSWAFLPGQAHVGLLDLPAGRHEVMVEWLSAGGVVIDRTPWRPVELTESGVATIVEHTPG